MTLSAGIRRTATLAAGAVAVGLAAIAFALPAQAATAGPATVARTADSAQVLAPNDTFNNLGLTTREAQAVQRFLAARYGYTGPIDGQLGTDSWMALQLEMVRFGSYTGPIDGIVDTETIAALQQLLESPIAGYTGPIDGIDSPETEAAFAVYAETLIADDGV